MPAFRLLARAAMDCDKGTRLGELLGFQNFHGYNMLQRITMKRNWSEMCWSNCDFGSSLTTWLSQREHFTNGVGKSLMIGHCWLRWLFAASAVAPAREQCQGCSAGSVARNDYSLGVLWCLWKACLEGVARCAIIGACCECGIKSNPTGKAGFLIWSVGAPQIHLPLLCIYVAAFCVRCFCKIFPTSGLWVACLELGFVMVSSSTAEFQNIFLVLQALLCRLQELREMPLYQ